MTATGTLKPRRMVVTGPSGIVLFVWVSRVGGVFDVEMRCNRRSGENKYADNDQAMPEVEGWK